MARVGGPGRGRVRICCKGAPRPDQPREEARNINDSPPAPRLDPGLCNRFGQTAPPRAREGRRESGGGRGGRPDRPGGPAGVSAVVAIGPAATSSWAPSDTETCTSHSKVQFQPSFSSAKCTFREQNAHLDDEEAGRGPRGPRRRSHSHHPAPAHPRHYGDPRPRAAVPGEKGPLTARQAHGSGGRMHILAACGAPARDDHDQERT